MANFVTKFSPQILSPELGPSSGTKLVIIQSTPKDHNVIKEPPRSAKATIVEKITEVPEVSREQPQVDLTLAWNMFVDGEKNRLGTGAGVVLKSLERTIF